MFQKNDEVKFYKGGMLDGESKPWWKKDGLRLGETYIVYEVSPSRGWIRVKNKNGSKYWFHHHPGHFTNVENLYRKIEKRYAI